MTSTRMVKKKRWEFLKRFYVFSIYLLPKNVNVSRLAANEHLLFLFI